LVVPGLVTLMTPPQLHMHLDVLFSAGWPPSSTVAEPGAQGAAVKGTQGIGVSTPSAAAVAAATVGLDGELHMPNGGILAIGLLSMMVAAGGPSASTLDCGITTSVDGATPNVHWSMAPIATWLAMVFPASSASLWTQPGAAAGIIGWMQTIDSLFQHARTLHRSGELDAAIACYRTVVERDPAHFRALNNLGDCLDRCGRHAEAEQTFRAACAAAPEQARPHYNLARQLQRRGDAGAAEVSYRRALSLDASLFDAYLNLARLLEDSDRQDEARALLEAAAALDADAALPHLLRGHSFYGQGRTRDALAAYERAAQMAPDGPTLFHVGKALETLKQYEAASAAFGRSLDLEPGSKAARQAQARALASAGRHDEAVAALRAWLAAEPDEPLAVHMLASLGAAPAPARASDDYVAQTFDSFADSFDSTLSRLQYHAPQLVAEALGAALGAPDGSLDILDAGCGTGLCGPLLAPFARHLTGVDLSAGMLTHAAKRGVYTALAHAELCDHLHAHPAAFDAVVSADTLCYFGALDVVFAAARAALRPAGLLVFTVEHTDEAQAAGFRLATHGRYAHTESYVRAQLEQAGFGTPTVERQVLRTEGSAAVTGLVVSVR
jgi:predicted TPR repeat methyltransferase